MFTRFRDVICRYSAMPPVKYKSKCSDFLFFFKEYREEAKLRGETDTKIISRKCGEAWNGLTKSEKRKYVIMAEADKKRADFEKKFYEHQYKKKNISKIQIVTSASTFYYHSVKTELKEKHPDKSLFARRKIANKMFKELSEEEKQPFHQEHLKDKKRNRLEKKALLASSSKTDKFGINISDKKVITSSRRRKKKENVEEESDSD